MYESARDWILNGPPIQPDPSDKRNPLWKEYKIVVRRLLNKCIDSDLLDAPIENYWTGYRAKSSRNTDRGCMTPLKKMLNTMTPIAAMLFWILHITSALGFFLIASTTSYQTDPAFSDKSLAQ